MGGADEITRTATAYFQPIEPPGNVAMEFRTLEFSGEYDSSGYVAIVLSRERSDIQLNGQEVGGDMRMTRVYKKFGTEWRVIATHGSFVRQ